MGKMVDKRLTTNPHWAVLPSLSLALIAAFLLLLSSNVSAQATLLDSLHAQEAGIESIKSVDMTITDDGVVYVSEELVVRRGDVIRRIISGRVDDLAVLDSLGRSIPVYESSPEAERQLLGFILEEANKTDEGIWIRYNTRNLTALSGTVRSIYYDNYFSSKNTIIKLHFPQDAQIISLEPIDLFRTNINSNELWLFPQEEYMHFNCTYKFKGDDVTVPTQTKQGSNLSIIWIILLAYVVIFTMLILIKRRKKPGTEEKTTEQ
jgi:hypothetical protein